MLKIVGDGYAQGIGDNSGFFHKTHNGASRYLSKLLRQDLRLRSQYEVTNCGVSGSKCEDWIPGGSAFNSISDAMQNCRIVVVLLGSEEIHRFLHGKQ